MCLFSRLLSSNKPNPNQLSNNVKPALVNGAAGAVGAAAAAAAAAVAAAAQGTGQTPGLGRACESCYSKSRPVGLMLNGPGQ